MCKCKVVGSVTIAVLTENESGASWYELDSKFGQVRRAFCGRLVIGYFIAFASILVTQWISACIYNTKTSGCRSACVFVQLKHFQILIGNLVLEKTTTAFLNVNIIPNLIVFSSSFEECNGAESPRKMILNKQRQAMIEGIGPLQIIYKLPHDEVLFSTNYKAICRRAVSYTHQNL